MNGPNHLARRVLPQDTEPEQAFDKMTQVILKLIQTSVRPGACGGHL